MAEYDIHRECDAVQNVSIFGKKYCATCVDQIKKVQASIDRHVTPRDCFFWYEDGVKG